MLKWIKGLRFADIARQYLDKKARQYIRELRDAQGELLRAQKKVKKLTLKLRMIEKVGGDTRLGRCVKCGNMIMAKDAGCTGCGGKQYMEASS